MLGTVTAAGGATAVCAEGTRVIERPLQPGDEISLNQVIRTAEGGVLAVQLADGGRLEIRGGRELSLDERIVARLSGGGRPAAQEAESDPEIEAMQQALLAGEDPSELEATAAGGGPQSEGGSSFVIIQRNGQRTLIELNGLDTDAAIRKLFQELGEDAILALFEELGIPVLTITMTEDDDSGRSARTADGSVEFDGRGVFGTLHFDPESGSFTYVLSDAGKQALNLLGVSPTGRPESVTEVFEFTLIDADGNRITAVVTVTVNGVDDPLLISNFQPVTGADHHALVDEQDLPDATSAGSFDIAVPDGFGNLQIAGVNISFAALTASAQTPVLVVTPNGSLLTITGYDGDYTGGTVHYRYTLGGAQTHPGDDALAETLRIVLSDDDGDVIESSLVVAIADDAPTLTGEVIEFFANASPGSTENQADFSGADEPGALRFDGAGLFGVLTREGDQWIYTLNAAGEAAASLLSVDEEGVPESIRETFTYYLADADGDERSATVSVTILGVDDPVHVSGSVVVVDEGDLPGGTHGAGATLDTHPEGISAVGTIELSAPDGFSEVRIGDSVLTLADLSASSPDAPLAVSGGLYGRLVVIGYQGDLTGGVITYRYTLDAAVMHDDPDLLQTGDEFPIVLRDRDGSLHDSAAITVQVIDDAAVFGAGGVRHGLMTGEPGMLNGSIDVQYGADGPHGPIGIALRSGLPGSVSLDTQAFDGYSVLTATEGVDILFTLTVRADGTYTFELVQARETMPQSIDLSDLPNGAKPSVYEVTTHDGTAGGNPLANPITFSSGGGEDLRISNLGIGVANNHINTGESLTMRWTSAVSDATLTFSRIHDYKSGQQVLGRESVAFTIMLGATVVATGVWVPPETGDGIDFVYDPATALALLGAGNYQTFGDWDGTSFDAITISVANDPDVAYDDAAEFNLVNVSTTELVPAEGLDLTFDLTFPAADGSSLEAQLEIDVSADGSTRTGFVLRGDLDDTAQVILGSAGDDTIHAGPEDEVDGADGFDTLVFDGNRAGGVVRNIEAFSSVDGEGNDRLTLSERDVMDFTDAGNVLRVLGDAGDALRLHAGDAWQQGATVDGFTTYTSNAVTVEVQVGIDVRLTDESPVS